MSAFKDSVGSLIDAVAKTHRVILSKDDPIMILHTMNEIMLVRLASTLDDMQQNFAGQLHQALASAHKDTVATTEKVLTAAVNAHKQAMDNCIEPYARALGERAGKALAAHMLSAQEVAASNRLASIFALVASIVTALAVAGFAYVVMQKL
jgi:uncharacterized protein YciW